MARLGQDYAREDYFAEDYAQAGGEVFASVFAAAAADAVAVSDSAVAAAGGSDYASLVAAQDATFDAKYTTALAAARGAGARLWVDPNNTTGAASNSNAGTLRTAPKLTMVNALAALAAGGELIVIGDGITVTDTTGVNVFTVGTGANGATWASGTSFAAMTIVRAETPFGVTFKYTTTGNVFGVGVVNQKGSYQWVDGINFDVSSFDEEGQYNLTGTFCRLTRCLYRSTGSAGGYADYKQPINASGTDCMVQDVHLAGPFRYGVFTGNGGSGGNVERNVFRRMIVRCDGYDSSSTGQPHASFACYGDNSVATAVGRMVYQNTIAIDGIRAVSQANADSYTWGAYYNPKITRGNVYQGAMALNVETSRGGFMVMDNIGGGTMPTMTDCVGWDIKYATIGNGAPQGIFAVNSGTAGGTWSRLTGGNMTSSMSVVDDGAGTVSLNSSLFTKYAGSQAIDGVPASTSYCAFENGDATGTNQVTFTTAPQWIVKTPYTTQGLSGGTLGANILYCYGAFCSHHGDAGYDTITTDPLWPYPYESKIKTFFAVSTGSGTPTRGFCAAGNDAFGNPLTLSRYIWQYAVGGTQTQIPSLAAGAGVY